MNETPLTVVGRLTQDPELRFTPAGLAVANFTIASNARRFDKQTNEWKDEPAVFWRCSVWRQAAENVAESLTKGVGVIATGTIRANVYTDRESGQERRSTELDVTSIGPDLRWGTAKFTKAERGSSSQAPQGGWGGGQQQSDPSTTNAPTGGAGNSYDEPPF